MLAWESQLSPLLRVRECKKLVDCQEATSVSTTTCAIEIRS